VSDDALRVAMTAAKWSQRPSSLLGVSDPLHALALDEALAVRLSIEEMRATQQATARQKAATTPGVQLPEGMRYATERDVQPW
jgi:hypothetical protein